MATRSMPDGVVDAERLGDEHLGADAVGGGDQHRFFHGGQFHHSGEAAEAADDLEVSGSGGYRRADAFNDFGAGIDVDAGSGVGQRFAFSGIFYATGSLSTGSLSAGLLFDLLETVLAHLQRCSGISTG